jgi:hypothetical protein
LKPQDQSQTLKPTQVPTPTTTPTPTPARRWTWALMGLQGLSFLALFLIMEPRRAELLTERLTERVDALLQARGGA